MFSGKGFTLIEMLVVVLIIGILAAIALPQYQLAVDKAEFAKHQAMVASLRDAYDEYVMIHGEGTANFEDLSFTLPDDFTEYYNGGGYPFSCLSNNTMFCCISKSGGIWGLIDCGKKDLSFIYQENFLNPSNTSKRISFCGALNNNKRAERLCSSFGTHYNTKNVLTPSGIWNSYKFYH
ncbi:MAG: type II secretion system GspH family protein [Elusimicrobiaceae bacterium]|nr:type II secretion system GspH family protein [Elusimicrobiaceae bacterium]